jgi:hypothetical protein
MENVVNIKPALTVVLVLCFVLLSACGGKSPSNTINDVQTAAAATFQALTQQAANQPVSVDTATSTATATEVQPEASAATATNTPVPAASFVTSTPLPVQIAARGSFVPYRADECEHLRVSFEGTIGKPVTVESVSFTDRVSGATGTACRVHGTGTGATYTMDVFSALVNLLPTLGWTEDSFNYGAGGPTGMATGFTKGGALGLLSVGWRPSADANCPKDQPISMCPLTPEQKLFDVTFDVADRVYYNPPSSQVCSAMLNQAQPYVPAPLALEIVDFTDFELQRGTACQLRAQGDGTVFTDYFATVQSLDTVFAAGGWSLINGADGPTGTAREYTSGSLLAIVSMGWKLAPGVTCPPDQPISACPLTPEQKIYTVTIQVGEK